MACSASIHYSSILSSFSSPPLLLLSCPQKIPFIRPPLLLLFLHLFPLPLLASGPTVSFSIYISHYSHSSSLFSPPVPFLLFISPYLSLPLPVLPVKMSCCLLFLLLRLPLLLMLFHHYSSYVRKAKPGGMVS